MLKYFVILPLELSTFRPYPELRSLIFQVPIMYGFEAVPLPEITPLVLVKSLSLVIRMGLCDVGVHVAAEARGMILFDE